MRVAVITPYLDVPEDWLVQCHRSVAQQTHPCTHIMVADGRPQAIVDTLDVQHFKLPVTIRDYGDTPRGLGSVLAISQGFDAIAYLDADNWYYPEHIATMVAVQNESKADVVSATRNLHRLDGSLLGPCFEVDGDGFVDTNCFFFTRPAFSVVSVWWEMEQHHHAIDDRVIWAHIKHMQLQRSHCLQPTVAYRTAFISHYEHFGEQPPAGARSSDAIEASLEQVRIDQSDHKR